jgi:hypothetical protein
MPYLSFSSRAVRRARRRAGLVGVLALAALVVAPVPAAVAATRVSLWVSPSGTDAGTCKVKKSPCLTVSYALTQATNAGTNINLLGSIDDEFTLNKNNVTVQSSPLSGNYSIRPLTAALSAQTPAGAPVQPIVYVPPTISGAALKNVTLDGSGRAGAGGCSAGAGRTGLYVRSAQIALTNTSVTHVSQGPAARGCQNGLAVYVRTDTAQASNVSITGGVVDDFDKNGITCNDVGTTCVINKTEVIGRGALGVGDAAQNGIQFGRGATGTIANVKVHDHNYTPDGEATGILLYNTGPGVIVKTSNLSGNNVGIYAINDGTTPGQTTANLTLSQNKVHDAATSLDGNVGHGIALDSTNGGTLLANQLWNNELAGIAGYGVTNTTFKNNVADAVLGGANGDGIFIGGDGSVSATATSNTFTGNKSNGNTGDGIHADAATASNTFKANRLNGNGGYEAHDESTGAGTAGTANTWTTNNLCPSGDDNPGGLCH